MPCIGAGSTCNNWMLYRNAAILETVAAGCLTYGTVPAPRPPGRRHRGRGAALDTRHYRRLQRLRRAPQEAHGGGEVASAQFRVGRIISKIPTRRAWAALAIRPTLPS